MPEEERENLRTLHLLCWVLFIFELAKILAGLYFVLVLADLGVQAVRGYLFSMMFSVLAIVSIFGLRNLRWWGVYLFFSLQIVNSLLAVTSSGMPMFTFTFAGFYMLICYLVVKPLSEQMQ